MTRVISGVVLAAARSPRSCSCRSPRLRVVACVVAGLAADEYVAHHEPPRAVCAAWRRHRWPSSMRAGGRPFPRRSARCCSRSSSLLWLAFERAVAQARTLEQAAIDLVAPIYVGAAARHARRAADRSPGPKATLLLMATVVVSDSAQYYTGRAFGRRPLAPAISPKKTVEGAIGGVVFGTLVHGVARCVRVSRRRRSSFACCSGS